jgi:hypothetical protein
VSVVSVPDIDPTWPIGRHFSSGLGNDIIHVACTDGPNDLEYAYSATVRVGAGTDFAVPADDGAIPFPFCAWGGPLSADGLAIEGAATSCPYQATSGPATMTLESVVLRLVAEDNIKKTARLFAHGTASTGAAACTFDFEDYVLTTSLDGSQQSVITGHHDETLPAPVPLTGWGSFDVMNVSRNEVVDVATYRRALAVDVDGALPAGLVLDANAYALKDDPKLSIFDVVVGVTNQGTAPLCITSEKISAVVNMGGLPVDPDLLFDEVDSPRVGGQPCLRPGEKGWLFVIVNTTDNAAFTNAARARVSIEGGPSGTLDKVDPTPLRVRQPAAEGLQIDFVGSPGSAVAYFLDADGAPLGLYESAEVLPTTAARPQLATVTFPLHPVRGDARKIMVYSKPKLF